MRFSFLACSVASTRALISTVFDDTLRVVDVGFVLVIA